MIVEDNGDFLQTKYINENEDELILTLADGKKRSIGKLLKTDGLTIYYKKVSPKNIYKELNAWGVAYLALEFLKDTDRVELACLEEKKTYVLTKEEIKDKGVFRHYKNKGFERQIFVSKEDWRITMDEGSYILAHIKGLKYLVEELQKNQVRTVLISDSEKIENENQLPLFVDMQTKRLTDNPDLARDVAEQIGQDKVNKIMKEELQNG